MDKVVMLRLANSSLLNDSRVLREAAALKREFTVSFMEVANEHYREDFKYDNLHANVLRIKSKHLGYRKLTSVIKYIEYCYLTIAKLRKIEPSVVHAHDIEPLLPALIYRFCFARKSKLVFDAHELHSEQDGYYGLKKLLTRTLEFLGYNFCDGSIVANESRCRFIVERYSLKKCPLVIMNVPEQKQSKIKIETGPLAKFLLSKHGIEKSESVILLYQGGLVKGRDLSTLIKAVGKLNYKYKLVFMGYGGYRLVLENLTRELHLTDRVIFHDPVPADDLIHYTADADIGIISYENTSLNKFYCAPNKLYEYLSANIPFIGSNLPEIRSISELGIGAVFEQGDPRSICEAIELVEQLLADKQRFADSISDINKRVNWENYAQSLLGMYSNLIASRNEK